MISLLHHFTIVGPNGKHIALVFESMGDNLLSLIKRFDYGGIPIRIVKLITRQVLLGLDYLHRVCGIIHTDLKPENFLLQGEQHDVDKIKREREDIVRKRRESELLEGKNGLAPGAAGKEAEAAAADGKKLSKSQKKRLKAKAKKQLAAEQSSNGQLAVPAAALREDAVLEEDDAGAHPMSSKGSVLPSPSASPSASFSSFSSMSSSSSNGFALPPSSSIASTVSSSSFTTDATISPSSSFASSSSFSPALQPSPSLPPRPSSQPQAVLTESRHLRSAKALPPPASTSHLDSMLAAFSSLSLSSSVFSSPQGGFPFLTKIADLGNGCWTDRHFTDDVTTRQYRAPEVLVGFPYGPPIDVWSVACLVFELITGDYLFDPKESPVASSASSPAYSRDEDHLALMMELLGRMPKRLTQQGEYSADYFTRKGELRRIAELDRWGLPEVLTEKYKLDRQEAQQLSDFLLPMLALDPDKRVTAEAALRSPWLWQDVEGGRQGGKERREGKPDTATATTATTTGAVIASNGSVSLSAQGRGHDGYEVAESEHERYRDDEYQYTEEEHQRDEDEAEEDEAEDEREED